MENKKSSVIFTWTVLWLVSHFSRLTVDFNLSWAGASHLSQLNSLLRFWHAITVRKVLCEFGLLISSAFIGSFSSGASFQVALEPDYQAESPVVLLTEPSWSLGNHHSCLVLFSFAAHISPESKELSVLEMCS